MKHNVTYRWLLGTSGIAVAAAFATIATILLCAVGPDLPADFYAATVVSPLILGTASLILTVSSRNASISERLRAACKTLVEAKRSGCGSRMNNAEHQVGLFHIRYSINQIAFVLLLAGLPEFVGMYPLAQLKYVGFARFLFYAGTCSATVACLCVIIEALIGQRTLKLEVLYTADVPSVKEDSEMLIRKRIDVLLFCNKQYDDIRYRFRFDIEELIAKSKDDGAKQRLAESYYARFWNHQGEQYRFYLKGLVDIDTFTFWAKRRRAEYIDATQVVGGILYADAWTKIRSTLGDDEFRKFITEVFDGSVESAMTDVAERAIGRTKR